MIGQGLHFRASGFRVWSFRIRGLGFGHQPSSSGVCRHRQTGMVLSLAVKQADRQTDRHVYNNIYIYVYTHTHMHIFTNVRMCVCAHG